MKKILILFFISLAFLFLLPSITQAAELQTKICDESGDGIIPGSAIRIGFKNGLVPCGKGTIKSVIARCHAIEKEENREYFTILYAAGKTQLDAYLSIEDQCRKFYPATRYKEIGASLVSESDILGCRCELAHIFILILNIYNFIIWYIATPLATLLIVIGGLLILISGGPGSPNPITGIASPNLYSTARNMIWWSVISVFLIWGSWLIINILLQAIGYAGAWSSPF